MGGYVPNTEKERQEMLQAAGYSDMDDLFADIPEEVRLKGELEIPAGMPELSVRREMEKMAGKNRIFPTIFRGAGAYRHYIPAAVTSITSKENFVTAYTPYQAEISQGILQSIFEYQTMICDLTGMDASNASVYDGASAAAEGVSMCRERKRQKVLISQTSSPYVIRTVQTYCHGNGMQVELIPEKDGRTDKEILREQIDPVSLGILKTPAEYGADVAVGEGQPMGLPLAFGGPYLGFMACTDKMMRKLPGRIVGQTKDKNGKTGYVLTLQAREQHIRREKASSNICSNQALCALAVTVYLASMGPDGLKEAAVQCVSKAHYLAGELEKIGYHTKNQGNFFHEFVTESKVPAGETLKALEEHGILGGYPLDEHRILWCCTEMNTREEMDEVIRILKEVQGC